MTNIPTTENRACTRDRGVKRDAMPRFSRVTLTRARMDHRSENANDGESRQSRGDPTKRLPRLAAAFNLRAEFTRRVYRSIM